MKSTVIIKAWTRKNFLIFALDSLFKQTHIPDEIIVTKYWTDKWFDKFLDLYNIKHYELDINNPMELCEEDVFGIRKANGDIIFFLDDDDTFEPNKIETILKEYENDNNLEATLERNVDYFNKYYFDGLNFVSSTVNDISSFSKITIKRSSFNDNDLEILKKGGVANDVIFQDYITKYKKYKIINEKLTNKLYNIISSSNKFENINYNEPINIFINLFENKKENSGVPASNSVFETIPNLKPIYQSNWINYNYKVNYFDFNSYNVLINYHELYDITASLNYINLYIYYLHDNFWKTWGTEIKKILDTAVLNNLKSADILIFNSEDMKNVIIDYFKEFNYDISTKPNFIITPPIKKIFTDFEYDEKQERKDICFIGRIYNKYKNFDLAVDFFKEYLKYNPNEKMFVFSEMKGDYNIENIPAEIKNNIEFYFDKDTEFLFNKIKNCKYCLIPSEYEGYGIPIAEAKMLGIKPIIWKDHFIPNETKELSLITEPGKYDIIAKEKYINMSYKEWLYWKVKILSEGIFKWEWFINYVIPRLPRKSKIVKLSPEEKHKIDIEFQMGKINLEEYNLKIYGHK